MCKIFLRYPREPKGTIGQPDLWLQPTGLEEFDPGGRRGVVLGQGAHVVVVVEAEGWGGDPVQPGKLLAEPAPEGQRADTLADPLQEQYLCIIHLRAGYGVGNADQVLAAE